MSEKIKITVVLHDEKSNTRKTTGTAENIILTHDTSMTIMSVLLKSRLIDGSFCGGRGDCGRCVVQFLEGAPLPTGVERARLTPKELRSGYRLACMARPRSDCVIKIVDAEDAEPEIVTEMNLPSENIDFISRKKYLSENQKSDAIKSGIDQKIIPENANKKSSAISGMRADVMKSFREEEKAGTEGDICYIIAVDLGTTTIAMQLRKMETGDVTDTYCERNPQRIYGSDVLSRIQASCAGYKEELRELVCEALLRGVRQFTNDVYEKEMACGAVGKTGCARGSRRIACMCIAGNTTMEHLLLGYDTETLGRAPFRPAKTGVQRVEAARLFEGVAYRGADRLAQAGPADFDFPVYIAPCISAFVGGDIVAGLYTLRMLPIFVRQKTDLYEVAGTALRKAGEKRAEGGSGGPAVLLIDLGTNGEMAITDGSRMIVTATAAGPAFEGDGSLVGTDRIAFSAKLLQQGIADETGLLEEPFFTKGLRIGEGEEILPGKENDCYFKQEDVRSLQMAKAAVRAGVEILWEEMGRPEIGQVYLAGGFGYYLDVEAAFSIGLLPSRMRGRVMATGNTSLAGAYELGCDLYSGRLEAAMLEKSLASIISINLAQREGFEGLYLKYMNLEEN